MTLNNHNVKTTHDPYRSILLIKPGAKILEMKKEARLTFRVRSDLKRELEAIASRESQNVTRVCEAFLLAGSDAYKKEGTKFLRGLLGRLATKSLD